MKFGVREITDVVFKATTDGQKLGSVTYGQYDPILFFDSAKTSTVESAVATVYAQGGRGNPRLLAWDGDKTVTFMFEDALMSRAQFAALSGAGLTTSQTIQMHLTEKATAVVSGSTATITLNNINGNMSNTSSTFVKILNLDNQGDIVSLVPSTVTLSVSKATTTISSVTITASTSSVSSSVLVDFYVGQTGSRNTIDAENFAGYYYVEANTLFRGTDGKDYPAQFTIPKAKVQSNFTFTMAPTGDPSTFTFMLDAFPAATRFDSAKNVLFTLEISDSSSDII
jgi:hypothetical protein